MDHFKVLFELCNLVFPRDTDGVRMPFYPFLVNFDGKIDRDALIEELKEWVNKSAIPDKKTNLEALEKAKNDDELFTYLIICISDRFPMPFDINVFFISNLWKYYGIAIRRCLGNKAKIINKIAYYNRFPSYTQNQIKALNDCIHSYNTKPVRKGDPGYIDAVERLMPTIRSAKRKNRTIKKHVHITCNKTKRIIQYRSIKAFLGNYVPEFDGGVNIIPDRFADYALENSNIR